MSFSSLDSLITEIEDELKEKNEIEQEDSEYLECSEPSIYDRLRGGVVGQEQNSDAAKKIEF